MIGAISTALSGLVASTKRVEGAANNIANAATPDYTPLATHQETAENGGVLAYNVPKSAIPGGLFGGGIDLTEEVVNLKLAEISYKANIATMKAAQEMAEETSRLLDKKV